MYRLFYIAKIYIFNNQSNITFYVQTFFIIYIFFKKK